MNTLERTKKIAIARLNGIKRPFVTMKVSENEGVPFWVLCAFLEQESGGGANVFGHDASIYSGAGEVTRTKYMAYKRERDRYVPNNGKRRMQGVGPMQLTWWEFQDEADALGGCWVPWINITVGAKILARHYVDGIKIRGNEDDAWRYVAYKYNGKQVYVDSIQAKFDKWKALVG